jgi:low affinity Fe/Cu permease
MLPTSSFSRLTRLASNLAGSPRTFVLAVGLLLVWAVTGPLFSFSDTWQLLVNTSTTIITFLMVFLIQNTQNRDSTAVQLKLDELIRSTNGAHNALMDLEELSQEDLDKIRGHYEELAQDARKSLRAGFPDTATPEIHAPL